MKAVSTIHLVLTGKVRRVDYLSSSVKLGHVGLQRAKCGTVVFRIIPGSS